MMQILGYVPDYSSALYREMSKEYDRDYSDSKKRS